MHAQRAFYAGLNGALAMTVLAGLIPFKLLPQNLGLIIGSLILREVSLSAWALGLVVHLGLGGLLAIGYAFLFHRVLHRFGWKVGLCLGALHAAVVGPALALLPMLNPLVPRLLPAPGIYLVNMGLLGTASFFAAHLLYGVVVGGVYADLPLSLHRRSTALDI